MILGKEFKRHPLTGRVLLCDAFFQEFSFASTKDYIVGRTKKLDGLQVQAYIPTVKDWIGAKEI